MAKLSEEENARRAANRRRKAALAAEEDAIRHENKRQEWAANGTYLTRAELEAGVHCRGCGLPIIDGLGDLLSLMKMTAQEREAHQAAEADFKRRHGECHDGRWSVSGSRTAHCGYCCPPPPLSEKQIEAILSIFASASRPNPAELDTWRLALTCGYVIDKTQHSSSTYWCASTTHCSTCGQTPGIVTSEKLPPSPARHAAEHRHLAMKLDEARREYERHQQKADAARRRIDKLNKLLCKRRPTARCGSPGRSEASGDGLRRLVAGAGGGLADLPGSSLRR